MVYSEFKIYVVIWNFYIYLILRLVPPEGPPWLKLRGQDKSRILDNAVVNLRKGRKTLSRKRTGSYKYRKIAKSAVYVFKHWRIFKVFGKLKAKETKVEYLRYNNFPFLKILTL